MRYDAGRVLAGTTLSHSFVFTNDEAERIQIVSDDDIRRNCGCSTVRPESRVLLPGECTRVFVELGTVGRKGPLRKGGEIIWTLENGEKRSAVFQVEADVVPPFAAEPELLAFSDAEVRAATVKEVALTSTEQVDWTTLSVSCSSASFQIVTSETTEEGARITVRCTMPEDREDDSGYVSISAEARSPSPDLPAKLLSLQFGVKATRSVNLAIRPSPMPVRFNKTTRTGTARCLMWGERLAALNDGGDIIELIASPTFRVKWSVQKRQPQSKVAVVDLSLLLREEAPLTNPTLTVTVIGNDPIVVPLVLIE